MEKNEIFDIAQALITLVEGDDVEFNDVEQYNPTWKILDLVDFIEDVPKDIEEYVNNLPDEKLQFLQKELRQLGYLN